MENKRDSAPFIEGLSELMHHDEYTTEDISTLLHQDHYTVEEAAFLLGMDPNVISQAAHRHELMATFVEHRVVSLHRDDLIRWLETR
jgi:transcriptional regulator with GAF, ATPase, and Fis domain